MNHRRIHSLLLIVLLLSLVLSACKKSQPELKPTGTPTVGATETPAPTDTPIPPPPTPLPEYQPPPEGAIPPFVIDRSPERGEELALDSPIELVFDRSMERASVERALVLSVDGGLVMQ